MEKVVTLVLCAVCITGLLLSVLLLPSIKTKNGSIPVFWIVPFVCAVLLVILGCVSLHELGTALTSCSSVNPAKILILFFSMSFISIYLDQQGFFKCIANKAVKKASGSQMTLFLIVYALTSVLTIFTSNDIVILTFVPFICYFCKNAKINPIPYIVSTFVSANTWSMMLIIGNPTNIYLATSAGITFVDYFIEMAFPTVGAGIIELVLLLLIFRKPLKDKIEKQEVNDVSLNKLNSTIGIVILASCIVLLALSSYIEGLDMWVICAISALILLVYSIVSMFVQNLGAGSLISLLKHLPWELIPFILSMFVLVLGLKGQGFSEVIFDLLKDTTPQVGYGITSFLACNVINNIPMSILYSTICNSNSPAYIDQVYASIAGSNLGAFLTPIGALAGIMFTNILKKQEVKYSFLDFIKYGALISLPTLAVTLLLLAI